MKLIQINTVCGSGSTGRTVTELADAISAEGNSCYIAYGQGSTDFVNSFKIGTTLENHLHNASSRILGKQGYGTKVGTEKLIQYIQGIRPDVIHLRNLHGNYLNLATFFRYLSGADTPVIWTLHDCWAFTGKCSHYTLVGCSKWKTQCHECPQVREYPPSIFFDRSQEMFADKKTWFTSVNNMTVVPVSNWLAGEVRQSYLSKYPIVPIYNWIDQDVFVSTGPDARPAYGIGKKEFVVLAVSASWKESTSKWQDFIKLSRRLPPGLKLVLVGGVNDSELIPENVTHIPYVHETAELAGIYSMADVYVHFSMEDTFGKVIVESLACGTPVIVYDSTACSEVVGDRCGSVVEPRDIDQILKEIGKIKHFGKHAYSDHCVNFASQRFNYRRNTNAYLSLYKAVAKK